jgi:hypothetical protein
MSGDRVRRIRAAVAAALLVGGCAMTGDTQPAGAAPVPVIVELAVPPAASPQTAISDAQSAVIAALPAQGVRVVRRYGVLPLLALEVDPSVLPTLLRLPQVKAVRPDRDRGVMN